MLQETGSNRTKQRKSSGLFVYIGEANANHAAIVPATAAASLYLSPESWTL